MKPRARQRGSELALLKGNAPHSKAARRQVECSTVLAELRRGQRTTKELMRRLGLSKTQVWRSLRSLRAQHLVTWIPQLTGRKAHAYTRVYLASSRAPRGRLSKAAAGAWSRRARA